MHVIININCALIHQELCGSTKIIKWLGHRIDWSAAPLVAIL